MKKQSIELTCIDGKSEGIRLDKFLTEKFPDFSRTYFQELISDGFVIINTMIVTKSSYKLKINDIIHLEMHPVGPNLDPKPVFFEVVADTKDFLVINKPAGLLVHHSLSSGDEPSLVNGLLYQFPEFSTFSDKIRPGIVHRLDKNTSGLILVARNQEAQETLMGLFKQRLVHKTYVAIVTGHPQPQGVIDLPVGRDLASPHKMSTKGIYGKPAVTEYTVQEYYENDGCRRALVSAHPITGRTHQIRVHFAALGFPLEGDNTYGTPSILISRHALHASEIEFIFKGKKYHYKQPLCPDFKRLKDSLQVVQK